jgi:hypothetical protein
LVSEALPTETGSKQARPNLRSNGASPRPYNQTVSYIFLNVQPFENAIREGPFPDVNTRLPDSGDGFITHKFVAANAHWGLLETIEAIKTIAAPWAARTRERVLISEISVYRAAAQYRGMRAIKKAWMWISGR